ncbi:MAG: hypothetical protein IKX00_03520 [Bacilli bacterium]|nr:hypothetical protein [Bacilli bacterium]
MEKITFNSIDELYNRLKPAFRSKLSELKAKKITFITDKDLWTFLSKTKWSKEQDLELCDMVNDILNVNENELINFIHLIR